LIVPSCSFYPKDSYDPSVFPFNLVRFYIGLEDPDVLIKDLEKALMKLK
jgi:cystathionine beta-lyase/cystathionine gamma-synthase